MQKHSLLFLLPLFALLSSSGCDKDGDTGAAGAADTGLTACAAVLDSHVLWAVTVAPTSSTCGEVGVPWQTVYGIRHSGMGYSLTSCDGVEAFGVVGGCEWSYLAEEQGERDALPAGGTWEVVGVGYAWEEPVDYCVLPDGLDWETEEVWTLKDPGTTGLAEDCEVTYTVTGSLW